MPLCLQWKIRCISAKQICTKSCGFSCRIGADLLLQIMLIQKERKPCIQNLQLRILLQIRKVYYCGFVTDFDFPIQVTEENWQQICSISATEIDILRI